MSDDLEQRLTDGVTQRYWQQRAERAEAERDATWAQLAEAKTIVAAVNNEVIGSDGYFTVPSCVEAIGKLKFHHHQSLRRAERAEAERDRLRERIELALSWAEDADPSLAERLRTILAPEGQP